MWCTASITCNCCGAFWVATYPAGCHHLECHRCGHMNAAPPAPPQTMQLVLKVRPKVCEGKCHTPAVSGGTALQLIHAFVKRCADGDFMVWLCDDCATRMLAPNKHYVLMEMFE